MFILYAMIFPNNKKYFGITKKLRDRQNKHKNRAKKEKFQHLKLYRAINKYGFENIVWYIYGHYSNWKQVQKEEIKYIAKYKTTNIRFGYNTTAGGEGHLGFSPSLKTRKKLSLSHKGKSKPKGFGEQLSEKRMGPGNPMFGKKSSDKQKIAVSLAARGEKNGNSKLSDAQVKDMKLKWKSQKYTKRQLAKLFDVNRNTIARILSGKSRANYYKP